ncbi:MAG: glycosyltransferase 87 family protein, partial [Ktedonobacterales bacterium]
LLPYVAASTVWLAFTRLGALGAALALADAFVVVIERRDTLQAPVSQRIVAILRQTSPRIGGWRFPAAPFALGAALFLLALPPVNAISWDSPALIASVLVTLALDAYVRGHPMLAGVAVALACGFSLIPLALVAAFLLRSAWRAAASTLLFACAVAAVPLLVFPAHIYGEAAAALRFEQTVYTSSDHNISLQGAFSTSIFALGHMGTRTIIEANRAGTLVTLALLAVSVGTFVVVAILRRGAVTKGMIPHGNNVIWLGFAAALSAAILALPLVWSDNSVFALIALLLVGTYPFLRERNAKGKTRIAGRLGDAAILVAATLAFLLQVSALPFNLDVTDPRLLDPHVFLYLARPIAAIIVWAVALGALLVSHIVLFGRARRDARASATQVVEVFEKAAPA